MLLLFLVVIVLLCFIYIYLTSGSNYFKEKGVKYVKPFPLVGSMGSFFTQSKPSMNFINDLYNSFPGEKYFGIFKFVTPVIVIRDPELAKSVMIKNFESFQNHEDMLKADSDVLWSKNLFSTEGSRWKDLRQVLSPVFTSKKMKTIFVLMEECAQNFVEHFENSTESNESVMTVEMKDALSRYTNDVIASVAFGVRCDSLKNKDNEFLKHGRSLTDFTGWNSLKVLLYGSLPKVVSMLGLKIVSKPVGEFFSAVIDETISIRKEHNIIRQDLIHLLVQTRQNKLKFEDALKKEEMSLENNDTGSPSTQQFLTNEDITAQAIIFYFGGFDTTSNVLSFCLYELAINPEVQSKLRSEIRTALSRTEDNLITYDVLADMKYLDNVVNETLRKWPQGLWLNRKCTKSSVIDETDTKLQVNTGDIVWIPVYGMHHDEKYFPNPERFYPERFDNDADNGGINMSAFLPFGSGPRNCIGSRFALMGMKILTVKILERFEIVPVEKTQIPITLRTDTPILMAKKGIHLGLKRLIV